MIFSSGSDNAPVLIHDESAGSASAGIDSEELDTSSQRAAVMVRTGLVARLAEIFDQVRRSAL